MAWSPSVIKPRRKALLISSTRWWCSIDNFLFVIDNWDIGDTHCQTSKCWVVVARCFQTESRKADVSVVQTFEGFSDDVYQDFLLEWCINFQTINNCWISWLVQGNYLSGVLSVKFSFVVSWIWNFCWDDWVKENLTNSCNQKSCEVGFLSGLSGMLSTATYTAMQWT